MDLGELDRDGGTPPYQQIAARLRAAMDSGELEAGDRLPSEAELVAHYGIARMTARQAIAELRAEGRAVAEQGRGTFVAGVVDLRAVVAALLERVERLEARLAVLEDQDHAGTINRR